MFDRIAYWCWNSLTIAWSYALALAGAVMTAAPVLAELLPGLKPYVPPDWMGLFSLAVAAVTFATRLRTAKR